MGIQKAERVRHVNDPDSSVVLLLDDLIVQRLHPRPVHFWAEMMFRVVAVVKPRPVIEISVGAHAPRDRFFWIAAVVAIIAVQI